MSWNYRVIQDKYGQLAIHEVYYVDTSDKSGSVEAVSVDPIAPHGDTIEDLREDLRYMMQALEKQTLVESEIKFVKAPWVDDLEAIKKEHKEKL
jgi:hypothetical protein